MIEPPADARMSANGLYAYFVALQQSGFTEVQALQLLGTLLAAQVAAAHRSDD